MSKKATVLTLAAVMILIVFGVVRAQEPEYTLDTPTLTATEVDGEVVLSWTEVEGATRYDLQVWDCVNEWRPISENVLRTTEAVHTDPADEITYLYTVQALNDRGEESDWAAISKNENDKYYFVRETVNPIPSPDFDIVAQADHIQLQFSNVEKAVGYQARVWYEGAGDDWLWLLEENLDLDSRTFSYFEVEPGVEYFFVMRSYSEDKCGFSDWSDHQRHTFAGTGGTGGGGTGGGGTGGGEATATPTATSNTGGPGPSLPRRVNTATPTPTATATATATNTATATATATPVRPTLYANVRTANAVLLRWEFEGAAGTTYELEYSTNGTWQKITDPGAASTPFLHEDLTVGTTYRWRVRAVDSQGTATAWSNEVSRTIIDRPDPTATPTHTPTPTRTPEPTPTPTTFITTS